VLNADNVNFAADNSRGLLGVIAEIAAPTGSACDLLRMERDSG
jgi:hypothetical protein